MNKYNRSQHHRKHYWQNTRWAILCGSLAVAIPYLIIVLSTELDENVAIQVDHNDIRKLRNYCNEILGDK